MKISVAMAAYNGAEYISEQIASILRQLGTEDELIVSDDGSKDNTAEIVSTLHQIDSRVKLIEGPGKGLQKNFEHAMQAAEGEVIFLSDQDDIWLPDKVKVLKAHFADGADLVLHNAAVVDSKLRQTHASFFEMRGSKTGFLKNLLKNSYMGCCMAFRRELAEQALPFPEKIPMHDQWIGLIAERCGARIVLEQTPLIQYRRHEMNASSQTHAGLMQMLKWRTRLIKELKKRG